MENHEKARHIRVHRRRCGTRRLSSVVLHHISMSDIEMQGALSCHASSPVHSGAFFQDRRTFINIPEDIHLVGGKANAEPVCLLHPDRRSRQIALTPLSRVRA